MKSQHPMMVNEFSKAFAHVLCHTGVPQLMEYSALFLERFVKAPFTIFPAGDEFVRHQRKQEMGKSPVITVIGG